jgi:hypothetical protein
MTILEMKPGKSYVLQNMTQNKHDKCLAISPYGSNEHEAYLVKCGMYGYPIGQRRYVDGSVFMCLNKVKDAWDRTLYRVLTPDGKTVHLFASGNKTKFRELK